MSGGIYRACAELIGNAVAGGVCREAEAWHMSPGELMRLCEARQQARVREMKDMDMLAWLTGQYAAVGLNSPGRYPLQPDRVREIAGGSDEMKRVLQGIAARRGEESE